MALGNRYKSAPGAGTLAALILVLVFGSPWYAEWAADNTNPDTAGGWWLRLLSWPRWSFDSSDSLRDIVVGDLKAILLVVLTLLFLYLLPGSQLARARGTISQFFAGWAAYIFAGGFAALFTTLFLANPSLLGAFQAAGNGAAYGLFVGWIVGFATLGGYRGTR
ncbi:hypothetical protein [Paractinoplanes brasiliensis]|uniref:Uncharacterized protein n=1 Tax=Paractinoplanes brasiliensis TaxID=52695 RepID=A0A4R6JYL3_9ACTN|nr:hypothetical protein [Actinoplanes brasiliensis]TDO39865.1 hypothetical protein C8E87_3570 [Actinoplanes brasiliensis]GID31483.1 hypothetical protein Abr02nite_64660 [Actinoplanes brasiliensis]